MSRRQISSAVVLSAAGVAAAGCRTDGSPASARSASEASRDATLVFPNGLRGVSPHRRTKIEGAVNADGRDPSI
jgi:hypothetical protein